MTELRRVLVRTPILTVVRSNAKFARRQSVLYVYARTQKIFLLSRANLSPDKPKSKRPFRITLNLTELPSQHGESRLSNIWRPLYREIPKQNRSSRLEALDICDIWKNLSFIHAKELAFWELAFHRCVQECLGDFVLAKFPEAPQWTSAFQLSQFVNRELAHVLVPVDVDSLVVKMLESSPYENYAGGFLERSHYNLASAVKLFLETRQCWVAGEEGVLTVDFKSTSTSKHLEISASVGWEPPIVLISKDSFDAIYVEPSLGQPSLCHWTKTRHQIAPNRRSISGRQILTTTVTKYFANGIVFQRVMRAQIDLGNSHKCSSEIAHISARFTHRRDRGAYRSSNGDYLNTSTNDGDAPIRVPSSVAPRPPNIAWTHSRWRGKDVSSTCDGDSDTNMHDLSTDLPSSYATMQKSIQCHSPSMKDDERVDLEERIDSPMMGPGLSPRRQDVPNNESPPPYPGVAAAAAHLTMRATKDLKAAMRLQKQVCNDLRGGSVKANGTSNESCADPWANSREAATDCYRHIHHIKKDSRSSTKGLPSPSYELTSESAGATQRDASFIQMLADIEQARIKDNYDQFRAARGVRSPAREDVADLLDFSGNSWWSPTEGSSNRSAVEDWGSSTNECDHFQDQNNQDTKGFRGIGVSAPQDVQSLAKYGSPSPPKSKSPLPKQAAAGEISRDREASPLGKSHSTPRLRLALPLSAHEIQHPHEPPYPPPTQRCGPAQKGDKSKSGGSLVAPALRGSSINSLAPVDEYFHEGTSWRIPQRRCALPRYDTFGLDHRNVHQQTRVPSFGRTSTPETSSGIGRFEAMLHRLDSTPTGPDTLRGSRDSTLKRARAFVTHLAPPNPPTPPPHLEVSLPHSETREMALKEAAQTPITLAGKEDHVDETSRSEDVKDEGPEAESLGPSPRHWKGKHASFTELVAWFAKKRALEEARAREQARSREYSEHKDNEVGKSPGRRAVLCDRGNGTEWDGLACLGTDEIEPRE